jgi:CRISPR-associated protein Cas1
MPSLYITEPGATLRLQGRSLLVTDRGEDGARVAMLEVEPHNVDSIGLLGDVHVTADALRHCLDSGIPIAWFDRRGELQGRCVPASDRNGSLRLAQYGAATDPVRADAMVRAIVQAKIQNAVTLLVDVQGNDPANTVVPPAVATLKELAQALPQHTSVEALRGVEGAAAAAFFGAFGSALRAGTGMVFRTRERRPPPDPVNALLSFASVLLGNRLAGLVEVRGLDPAIGFLHELRAGRPSLALDMLEEWRTPIVERFVLRVCNLRSLRPEHFEADAEDPRGVRMTRDGLRAFFVEWEKFLLRPVRGADGQDVPVVAALGRQVDAMARALAEGSVYQPFVMR